MKDYIHVSKNEQVLWEGKPAFVASVIESIFNPLLIFSIVWVLADGLIIGFSGGVSGALALFFIIHLMPVWIYLGGVLTSGLKAKNTYYVVTDQAVYFQSGIFTVQTEREPLNEVTHTGMHRGVIDQICGLGDVTLECVHDKHTMDNIRDYEKVASLISDVSTDTYTDTMYPNDLRPKENHGYRTRYNRDSSGFYLR